MLAYSGVAYFPAMIENFSGQVRRQPSEVSFSRSPDEDVAFLLAKAIVLTPRERQQLACEIFLLRVQQQELFVRFPAVHSIVLARAGSKSRSLDADVTRALGEIEQRFRSSRGESEPALSLLQAYHTLAEVAWSKPTTKQTLPFATAVTVRAQELIMESYALISDTRRLFKGSVSDLESVDRLLRRELARARASAHQDASPLREREALQRLSDLEDAHRMPFELLAGWAEQFLVLKRIIDRLSDRMYRGNVPLVIKFARAYQGERSLSDVIQDANVGLTRAIRGFDASRGYQFSTYAVRCIKTAVQRGAATEGRKQRLSKSDWETVASLRRMFAGAVPSDEDLLAAAEELQTTVLRLRRLLQKANGLGSTENFTSLSAGVERGEGFEETLASNSLSAPAQVESQDLLEGLRTLLSHLDDRERMVIESRFGLIDGEPKTLEEIGVIVGVSKERIRQIQEELLLILRVGIQEGTDAFLRELKRRANRSS